MRRWVNKYGGAVESGAESGSVVFTHVATDAFALEYEGGATVSTSRQEAETLQEVQNGGSAAAGLGAGLDQAGKSAAARKAHGQRSSVMLSRYHTNEFQVLRSTRSGNRCALCMCAVYMDSDVRHFHRSNGLPPLRPSEMLHRASQECCA